MGQELPRTKRILELNPEHALVTGLRTAHEANADDPPRFTRLFADRLARSL